MAKFLRLCFLFFVLGRIADFYDMSTFTHVATIITISVMIVLLPEKYHP